MSAPVPTSEEVEAFLVGLHGAPVSGLHALEGGFWSAAFGYRMGGRDLVLRLGSVPEGFEMDRLAMGFDGPDLPVPEVLDIGEALGCAYAISARHHGRFLETIRPDESTAAGSAMVRTLGALRALPADPHAPVAWYPSGRPSELTWRRWLTHALIDDPGRRVNGWRSILAADAGLDRLFRTCEGRIGELVGTCPERRDLIHGDLLNRNVLIADDASRITAIFSWKCSVRGDFLFDVAWCTFWGAWHPGIAQADLYDRVLASPSLPDDARTDAALRHHCYELQIGATHLGWNAWTGNHDELEAVAAHTANVLDRGPRDPIIPATDELPSP